jgi:hypothetical protein
MLSWQLRSGGSSGWHRPVTQGLPWWNDRRNDRLTGPTWARAVRRLPAQRGAAYTPGPALRRWAGAQQRSGSVDVHLLDWSPTACASRWSQGGHLLGHVRHLPLGSPEAHVRRGRRHRRRPAGRAGRPSPARYARPDCRAWTSGPANPLQDLWASGRFLPWAVRAVAAFTRCFQRCYRPRPAARHWEGLHMRLQGSAHGFER